MVIWVLASILPNNNTESQTSENYESKGDREIFLQVLQTSGYVAGGILKIPSLDLGGVFIGF